MKNYLYILIIFFSLGFISCEKDIEFNGEITDSQLVVNCLIEADSTIKLDISLSNFFLDSKDHFDTIKNADVKLYINNQYKEKLNYFEGYVWKEDGNTTYRRWLNFYYSQYKPQTGDSIKIVINAPGHDEITATTRVVANAVVAGISSSMDITNGGSYDIQVMDSTGAMITIGKNSYGYAHIKLKIDDPADEQNYYRLVGFNDYGQTYFELDDPVFGEGTEQSIFDIGSYNQYGVFSDELFNGLVKEINFSVWKNSSIVYDEYKERYPYFQYDNQKYYVNLEQISKEMYLYLKTKTEAVSSINNPFSEPVQIYTNIRGGIGILGTFNKLDSLIRIPD